MTTIKRDADGVHGGVNMDRPASPQPDPTYGEESDSLSTLITGWAMVGYGTPRLQANGLGIQVTTFLNDMDTGDWKALLGTALAGNDPATQSTNGDTISGLGGGGVVDGVDAVANAYSVNGTGDDAYVFRAGDWLGDDTIVADTPPHTVTEQVNARSHTVKTSPTIADADEGVETLISHHPQVGSDTDDLAAAWRNRHAAGETTHMASVDSVSLSFAAKSAAIGAGLAGDHAIGSASLRGPDPSGINSLATQGHTNGHPTGNIYIDALIDGSKWSGGPITYSFASGDPYGDLGFNGAPWTTAEMNAFVSVLQQYQAVCTLTFAQAASPFSAQILWFKGTDSQLEGNLGWHDFPDGAYPNLYGAFNDSPAYWNANTLQPGGDAYDTILHEIGHGLGLAHPHDGGTNDQGDATIFPGATEFGTGTYGLNQSIWTVMSYNAGWDNSASNSLNYGQPLTPMALDIAALQQLYGANMTFHTGGDTYLLPGVSSSGTGWSCIWDAGGTDTISAAGIASTVTIDLRDAPLTGDHAGGYVSWKLGVAGGFTIAHGVTIENATGGSGDDTLTGNDAANTLDGGAGKDAMSGGKGDDTYYVGEINDVVTEGANEGADTVRSTLAVYTLADNVENLVLSGSIATLGSGNTLSNTITGNELNNVLDGKAGADTLIGGKGDDSYSIDELGDVVIENSAEGNDTLSTSVAIANANNYANVENFHFTGSGSWTFTGNDANNSITGGSGDDALSGGKGDDIYVIDGLGDKVTEKASEGNDTVSTSVSITDTTKFANIENFIFTGQGDWTFAGSNADNIIRGNDGNDVLDGGVGADKMTGGKGNDTYYVDDAGDQVIEYAAAPAYAAPSGFVIKGTADIDGDGQTDVLLLNPTTGLVEIQLIQNGVGQAPVVEPSWSGIWAPQGFADLNGDGKKDILYTYAGQQYGVFLNGTTVTGQGFVTGKTADAVAPLTASNPGTDTVIASLSYKLVDGVENLTLKSGAGSINATGNGVANLILGNEGSNLLTGGAGVDTLTGNGGADTFVFGVGDTGTSQATRDVIADFTVGTDKLDLSGLDQFRFLGNGVAFDGQADALHTITSGGNTIVEGDINGDKIVDFQIELSGSKALTQGDFTNTSLLLPLTLTGDGNANTLTGGRMGDTLSGQGGNDILIGNDGDDILKGDGGADQMTGGKGNDTYYVDDAGDLVSETASVYAAPSGFVIKGTADIDGDGQTDVLLLNPTTGLLEIQLIQNGVGQAPVVEPSWSGIWAPQGFADLNGDGKKDILYTYGTQQYGVFLNGTTVTGQGLVAGKTADAVVPLTAPNQGTGTDTVNASLSYKLGDGVENLTLASGAGNINGTGNAAANLILGNEGNNVLTGGVGVDTLTGNGGADTFVFGVGDTGTSQATRDVITDFTVGTDKLDLSGLDQFRFLGNGVAFDGQVDALHTITSGGNTIVEGDINGDKVTDFQVELSGSKALTQGDFTNTSLLLPLTLTGDGNANTLIGGRMGDTLSGQGGNDILIGNDGDDILKGDGGADQMTGGKGNDTYYVDDAGDLVSETASVYAAPSGFVIKGTADIDGDGQTDVLLLNPTTGLLEIQLIQNGVGQAPVVEPSWSGIWAPQGFADLNGDGKKDILYTYGTQQYGVFLNGTTVTGQGLVTGKTADAVIPLTAPNQGTGTDTVIASLSYKLGDGVENLTLASGAGNNSGTGNGATNVLLGNEGNNVLTGGAGVDTLTGNGGVDTFVFGAGDTGAAAGSRDVITDFTVGTDKLDLSGLDQFRFLGNGVAFDGQAYALHTITSGSNTIVEGDINGDKAADFQIELNGSKMLTQGDLTDASLLLPRILTGDGGANTLTGGRMNDTLSGQGGNDILIGNDGDDILKGDGGADQMTGGKGNDTYYVDEAGDQVIDSATPDYTAPSGFVIKGTADIDGDGQADALLLNPTTGLLEIQLIQNGVGQAPVVEPSWSGVWAPQGFADLNGDGKKDILYTYGSQQYGVFLNGTTVTGQALVTGKTADAVVSLASPNQGTDTVIASLSYKLGDGVENLTLASGAGNINGTGNAAANVILGNEGNNLLTGGAGVDTLTGNGGADTFVFGAGDTGATAGSRDVITDFTVGTDKLDLSGLDQFRFLGNGVAFDGQADALHTITSGGTTIVEGDINGDKAADFQIELSGSKTLTQGDFTDASLPLPRILTGDGGANTLTGGRMGDTLSGQGGNDILIGNDGDDILKGDGGADQMTGGKGNDTYYVDDAGDQVIEGAAASTYAAPSGFVIKGTADIDGDGQTDVLLLNPTTGVLEIQLIQNGVGQAPVVEPSWSGVWAPQGFADLNGDGKKDILYTYGSQQYAVFLNGTAMTGQGFVTGKTADAVVPLASPNQGMDTVIASLSYKLGDGVENLTLKSGAGNINGTGNAAANVILGNEGDNVLTGGAGVDTLTGNGGADTFVFAAGDTGAAIGSRDVITDFTVGTDNLDLTGLGQFRFLGNGAAFDGQANALHTITSGGNTIIEGDINGDKVADFAIELTGKVTLTEDDFVSGSIFHLPRPAMVTIVNDDDLGGSSGIRTAVSSAGDLNNDGYADFVIGMEFSSNPNGSQSGNAYVVYGSRDGIPADLSLSDIDGANGFKLWGTAPEEGLGFGVDSAGDFNGDGVGDLLLSAPWYISNGPSTAYLIYGNPDGSMGSADLKSLDSTEGVKFVGQSSIANGIGSVSSLGDINADGVDDIALGFADDGNTRGISYVVFGTGGAVTGDLSKLNGTNGFKVLGEEAFGGLGQSVSQAGDINGDGINDLIVSDNDTHTGIQDHHTPRIIFGHAGAFSPTVTTSALDGTKGFSITGMDFSAGVYFNQQVGGGGDVNGDGYSDLVFGTEAMSPLGRTYAGEAFVVFGHGGAFSSTMDISTLNGTNGFAILGAYAQQYLGNSVSIVGDLNGDGYDDVVVGGAGAYVTDSGHAYVLYGKASGFSASIDLSTLSSADGFAITGGSSNDHLGWSVSGAGDIDGDGLDDLIIASPGAVAGHGQVEVIFGQAAASAIRGTDFADTLNGTSAADIIIGGQGHDTIFGAGGKDSINGGSGNDQIHVSDRTVFRVDGGSGADTLHLDFSGTIDFGNLDNNAATSDRGKISNIETIDVDNGSNNAMTLHLADVLDIDANDTNVGGVASLDNVLKIDGNAGDTLHLIASEGWGAADTSTLAGYAIFTDQHVRIAVDTDIAVTVS